MNSRKSNKSLLTALMFFLTIGLMSCDKEDDITVVPADKKIFFDLLSNNPGYGSGNDTTIYSTNALMFDINDFAGINSAKLVLSNIRTQLPFTGGDTNAQIKVELINLTNNQTISGSSILTDDVAPSAVVSSGDFLNNIPKAPFNLGIRIINPDPSKCGWFMYAATLVLQR